ncbi:VOC family protein [Lacicoccus alkaliphilus]|uniref:Lactoylglutathione lyase n=1 Tax=Lacicoccus alkaliphilus DSM 16010 TaxID=1123231 RepID=A0A1M7JSZ0_9BACL|nr:VOC family protein [Salinicoccus alkaliphilus]SHM56015.1 lactoylglutathione lyase [Salinicoccus alkaliphilus DSM 16010]
MIDGLESVMLYVDNQEQSVAFWTKDLGFVIKAEDFIFDDYKSVEVAPSLDSETSIVIFDKAFIREAGHEVNLETPSLMFRAGDLDALYADLNNKGIRCGDIVNTPDGRVFNFSDDEENYFAVKEVR